MSQLSTNNQPDHGQPQHDESAAASEAQTGVEPWPGFGPIKYELAYMLLIVVSTFDIIYTWLILERFDGGEINPFANIAFQYHSIWGLILYKFGLMVFFIVLNEEIGRRRDSVGRRMSVVAIAISSIPIFWSTALVLFLSP